MWREKGEENLVKYRVGVKPNERNVSRLPSCAKSVDVQAPTLEKREESCVDKSVSCELLLISPPAS